MVENLLKFDNRVRVPTLGHEGLTAHVGRMQATKTESREIETVDRQFVGQRDLQALHAVRRLPMLQFPQRSKHRDVGELRERILGESPFQIIGERLRSGRVSRKREGKAGSVFEIPTL